MSQLVLNREQSRRVDVLAMEKYGLSGLVLMENAGRGAVDILRQLDIAGPIVICCGRGNNGGDGFVMARHLEQAGIAARLLLFTDPKSLAGDAAANWRIVEQADLPRTVFAGPFDDRELDEALAGAGCVVDALLGTGSRGEPRPPLDRVIDAINRQPAPAVAVDLPSGLDCDTGAAATHTVRAAHTITFVAAKQGFLVREAAPYVGRLHVVSIGVPQKLLAEIAAF